MMKLYKDTSFELSKIITKSYSTSFSLGILAFSREYRDPIYGIYGFVRLADEIVDTFHDYDKKSLMKKFRQDTIEAIENRISTNMVLHSFQEVVHEYKIDWELIDAFLTSMEMDLYENSYERQDYDKYIYGSAEVVGLMCLKVFVGGDREKYDNLKDYAKSLGSAFQKVNFLRDIKSDIEERGRIYLPGVHEEMEINDENKDQLEKEVENEFKNALKGILALPIGVKLGVYSAYLYYLVLFRKIRNTPVKELKKKRVRVSNIMKLGLLIKSFFQIRIFKTA